MKNENPFSFEISLSVLNHLGRNLYRSFITVLGEAISNSWDADAKNVWIYIDREKGSLVVKDDGHGMDSEDFQSKFLKIGYSKRNEFGNTSENNRPFIGRKGIGKLAMLSCAEKVTIISKKQETSYIGGVIDNAGLDDAITDDLTPQEYSLGKVDLEKHSHLTKNHKKGTIIVFENINDGVRNTLEYLRRMIALYFRFSLLDNRFNIFVEDEAITSDDLEVLAQKTQFIWIVNKIDDPFIEDKLQNPPLIEEPLIIENDEKVIYGFIASVEKPSNLKVLTTEERVSVDLFVNGRLREKDILKHVPTARIVESYLYGQIHYNELDDENDRFTSSREGIVADDPKFKALLEFLKSNVLKIVIDEWDELRRKHIQEGDSENDSVSTKERKSRELYGAVATDFELEEGSKNKKRVDSWIGELAEDAQFSFSSFAECYISENLLRKYIIEEKIDFSAKSRVIQSYKESETDKKRQGRVAIEIRQENIDLSYLDMYNLSEEVDRTTAQDTLTTDAKTYRPIRNALMHTALLTDVAKRRLTTIYDSIRQRIITLLDGG